MNKFQTNRPIPELTLSTNFRQKHVVLDSRGPFFISRLFVRTLPRLQGRPPLGLMVMGSLTFPCAIGRNGIGPKGKEGDGRTPIGQFKLVGWRRRKEAWTVSRPDARAIARSDGWCDDPASNEYNRAVVLPSHARAENLWRDDGLYDLIGILDFNFSPRIKGRGSAIFLHLAHADFGATAGCLALQRSTMRKAQFKWSAKLLINIV